MADPAVIARTCIVSPKGQTTLPLAVRQVLGVRDGGEVVFRTDGHRVVVEAVEAAHEDPAIGAFLGLIAADIAAARAVSLLPADLLDALEAVRREVDVDLDQPIEGDVCL
ncbi:type II toxin-antitoxin system PrlF family antitoxin [Zavarzinia sp.]|uniref:type II toxin-antitoxin system PrlF family antitoxin n=1 Tax=Zavarzinia sp. TaxID=2027920 RepID=UPI003565AE21